MLVYRVYCPSRQNFRNEGGGIEYRITVLIVRLEKFERLWFPDKRELRKRHVSIVLYNKNTNTSDNSHFTST